MKNSPEDYTIYGNRAAAFGIQEKYAAAIDDAEKCIELKPDWSTGYQRKSMALQSQGHYEEALNFKLIFF